MNTRTFIERRQRERRQTPVQRRTAYGDIDEHYERWRSDHMQTLDAEYRLWRQGGSKNFPADFETWRLARQRDADDDTPPGDMFYERS